MTYTNKKEGISYSYTMTYDEYKEYVTDYINEVNRIRQKEIATSEYTNASNADKADILEKAKSEAKKYIRDEYIDRLAEKFNREE